VEIRWHIRLERLGALEAQEQRDESADNKRLNPAAHGALAKPWQQNCTTATKGAHNTLTQWARSRNGTMECVEQLDPR